MKIKLVEMENFQGVGEKKTIIFKGRSATIYGANGTGKTTLANAWSWLTHGKDVYGRTKFDIRPLDDQGKLIPEKQTTVAATVELDGGRILKLQKVIPDEADGVNVNHYVDDVPMKKGEYDKTIESMFPSDEILKTLSSTTFFCTEKPHGLGWEGRRRVLYDLCRLPDAEVVAANVKLNDLLACLGGRFIMTDRKKVWSDQKKKLVREQTAIEPRIKEARRGLAALGDFDPKKVAQELKQKRAAYKEIMQEGMMKAADGPRLAELRAVEEEIETYRREQEEVRASCLEEKNNLLHKMEDKKSSTKQALADYQVKLKLIQEKNNETLKKLQALRAAFREEKDAESKSGKKCPSCLQEIPLELQQEAKKNLLVKLNTEGKTIKAQWEEEGIKIQGVEKTCKSLEEEVNRASAEVNALTGEIGKIRKAEILLPPDLADKKKEIQNKALSEAKPINMENRIEKLNAEIAEFTEKLGKHEQNQVIEKRIEELKTAETEICGRLEDIDQGLYLVDEWERTKASLVEESVNSLFKNVSFRFSRPLENGKSEECCDPMVGGVSYGGSLNGAAKINAGLEVIDVLSEFWGVSVPFFVDGAESVDDPYPVRGQMILLIDRKEDKKLRLELDGEEGKE